MNMLYDSDTFVVVHLHAPVGAVGGELPAPAPTLERHGFEIVDKRSGKELYLDGSWAELFHEQIRAWQLKAPSQQEVEDTLERYAVLAQNPVVVH